ncbi:MAG: FprA family A-type flavoprotein [Coriobacteriia bacterium]|nr:FprA family A-type flavoprotein [Coriobacteriia bacterium]
MNAVPVTDSIHWVGAIDWNLRDFHGFETPRGSTYNAYLAVGADKVALVDTVKVPFVPELLQRVASVVALDKIDYIVVNHVEPDHNGGLRLVMQACPNAKVVASAGGVRGVAEYHGSDLQLTAVGPDDSLDLGGLTLRFMPMPMVHWPDSMFTYCPEQFCLMPNDAFGQHLASSSRFADEVGLALAVEELITYYANILMPLGPQVAKAIEKVVAAGWVCKTIAPSHGVIWRERDIATLLDTYGRCTSGDTYDKLVVAYGTMWGSTDILAREIADGAIGVGCEVKLFDVASTPYAHITRHVFDGRALLLGSPTLHHGMLYRPAGYLQYLAGLKPKDKAVGAFGSYGWSSGATKQIAARFDEMGLEMPFGDFTCKYAPSADELAGARAWGEQFGRLVIERGKL